MYAVYDIKTGEIKKIIQCPASLIEHQIGNDEYYMGADSNVSDDTHYVDIDTESILIKQDYELDTLPIPCIITIEGVQYEAYEQPFFEFDAPGIYEINVDAGVKYLKKDFKVDYQS